MKWYRVALIAFSILPASRAGADDWPDLSKPAREIGGGERDAAVVVGVENYFAVPGVPGAKSNAGGWYEYLTVTRGVPAQNVMLLTNEDATREGILDSARTAAGLAGKDGTLWFVFIGHGAPSADGKDGLLVAVDAQQKVESLRTRSVRRGELLKTLGASPAGSIRVVLDACFSGRGQDGTAILPGIQPLVTVAAMGAIDPRIAVLTAAKGNQFAGALPGADRPAFSYLVLGGLRGWAAEKGGSVTAGSLWHYAKNALAATLRGRDQTPDLIGSESAMVAASAGEKGPNLAKLAVATAGGGAFQFNVSPLPEVPKANQPSMTEVGRLPRAQMPGVMGQAEGIDFSAVDVDALGKYDEAVKFERGDASPESKAAKWRALAVEVQTYAGVAAKRAAQWDDYAEQAAVNSLLENDKGESSPEDKAAKWKKLAGKYPKYKQTANQRAQEWERYAKELPAMQEAKKKRDELMDKDWSKLEKLLSYSVVSAADKRKFALTFVQAYGKTSHDDPYVQDLAKYLPAGTVKETQRVGFRSGKIGIQWINFPGGIFTMGADDLGEYGAQPRHEVEIRPFEMAKTLVTVEQYKACVDAGACTTPAAVGRCNWGVSGHEKHPMNCVDWEQARKFSAWAGGRLPTEAEWEYAARSGGKEQKYPWGDEDPTCERAVSMGCGSGTEPVCSKPVGNTEQGLCDMAGNVEEWVEDCHHDSYNGAPSDGSAWESPATSFRVVRGGSFGSNAARYLRADNRYCGVPGNRYDSFGFRPARSR